MFPGTTVDHIDAKEIQGRENLEKSARLFKVNAAALQKALTSRTIFTLGETVMMMMGTEASMDVRDAFVKGVYGHMVGGENQHCHL